MEVSKEELLHIAILADLNLKDEEIDSYLENLQEILDFAQTVSSAPINDLDETIGATENVNVFFKVNEEGKLDTSAIMNLFNAEVIMNNKIYGTFEEALAEATVSTIKLVHDVILEKQAVIQIRTHFLYYLKNMPNNAEIKNKICSQTNKDEIIKILD